MPKRKRPAKIPTPAWHPSPTRLGGLRSALGSKALIVVGIVGLVVVAAGFIVFAILRDYLEERALPGSAAVTVGETTFNLDYFARRLRLLVDESGGLGSQLAQQPRIAAQFVVDKLVEEEIVRTFANELGVLVTAAEVEDELAARLGLEKSDPNFQTAYQQELRRAGFSDAEYRQLVEAQLLADKVRERLGEGIAAEAEQVHYRQIVVRTQQEADAVIARLGGGEEFAALAQELSLDTTSAAAGGDAGWLARGQASQELEDTLFALEPGPDSHVFSLGGGFFIFQVMEKGVRPLDADQREQVLNQSYRRWVAKKQGAVKVVEHVLTDEGKLGWALSRVYRS